MQTQSSSSRVVKLAETKCKRKSGHDICTSQVSYTVAHILYLQALTICCVHYDSLKFL